MTLQASWIPIFGEEVRDIAKNCPIIIGPDTALIHYQLAHLNKDYRRKDEVKEIAKRLGYNIGFDGKKYKAHYLKP